MALAQMAGTCWCEGTYLSSVSHVRGYSFLPRDGRRLLVAAQATMDTFKQQYHASVAHRHSSGIVYPLCTIVTTEHSDMAMSAGLPQCGCSNGPRHTSTLMCLLRIVLGPRCCPFRFSWLCSRLRVTSCNRPLLRGGGSRLRSHTRRCVVLCRWSCAVGWLCSNLLCGLRRLGAPLILNLGPGHGGLLWSHRGAMHWLCCNRLRYRGSVGRL